MHTYLVPTPVFGMASSSTISSEPALCMFSRKVRCGKSMPKHSQIDRKPTKVEHAPHTGRPRGGPYEGSEVKYLLSYLCRCCTNIYIWPESVSHLPCSQDSPLIIVALSYFHTHTRRLIHSLVMQLDYLIHYLPTYLSRYLHRSSSPWLNPV